MIPSKREQFGSSFTFILAMAGSAIGLGNIWRFPFMVGEHGGGAFIVAYLICSMFIALPCFLCESLIGKRARVGAYGAFEKLAPGSKWKWVGAVCVFACFIIISYYCVVGGWSFDFLVRSFTEGLSPAHPEEAVGIFGKMASSPLESLTAFMLFFGATALIVLGGVKKGIEKFTKITTPMLFVLMLAIVVYSVTLSGSSAGIKYIMQPDLSKLGASGWACALGQAFFSMSLGVGTVLIYSSYMQKDDSVLKSGFWTSVFDSGFAIIAALAVMPAVFSAGIEPGAGPSLVYETLPYIFASMGIEAPVASRIVTFIFFLAILMAALTSSISMFEVCVEHAMERFKCKRWHAVLLFFVPVMILGGLCTLSFGCMSGVRLFDKTIFDLCDYLCSNILMTLGALAFTIFVGWKMPAAEAREEFTNGGTLKFSGRIFNAFRFLVRWVIPPVILLIFVSNLL